MKKKLIIGALSLFLGLSLASCDKKEVELNNKIYSITEENEKIKADNEKLSKENEELISDISKYENGEYFTIKYVDYLGKASSKTYLVDDYDNVLDALKADNNVEVKESQYGSYINRINNSFVDNNWSIMIYENYDLASSGIDDLEINAGDVFEFKHECWNTISSGYGTMDETDILVDKIIYSYAKNQMKGYLSKTASYTAEAGWDNSAFGAADYWSFIFNDFMIENNYDKNVFNVKDVPTNLKSDLEAFDVTKLSGAQFGKYYFAAKGLGVDLNGNFKTSYQNYLNNLPETYDVYKEYEYPFTLGISKKLNVTSTNFNSLINTTYRASTEFGIDGLSWQLASLSQFKDLAKAELSAFEAKDYGNAISTSLAILPYAALGENPRSEEYKKNGKDLIEILIENYYDSENKIIKYNKEESINTNTPQIYTYLAAYKVARDSGKKVSIFA